MLNKISVRRLVSVASVGAVAVGLSVLAAPGPAQASAESALLYQYNFTGTSGTVANSAPSGVTAPLGLSGAWTSAANGVHFTGNLTGQNSIGHADPAGDTLNEPATAAVGIGAYFTYQAPTSGGCFGDSLNITQVGRFTAYSPQAKLQMTNCGDYASGEYPQCRMAGSSTPGNVYPVTSTVKMVGGDRYVVTCRKTPDASGKASVVLSVTNLDAAGGAKTVTQTFSVAALGAMTTTAALSAGNKYPLPPANKNTDQFQGVITRTVLCGGTTANVTSCLASYAGA